MYCIFSSLLIFLLRCLCSDVSWLPVLVFVSQAFTDFHFPNLFYSSFIDYRPVPEYHCTHSYQEVWLSPFFSSASPTFSPHPVQMLFCLWFHHHPRFQSFSFFLSFLEKFPFSFQLFSPSAFPVMWHHIRSQFKKRGAIGWGYTGDIRKWMTSVPNFVSPNFCSSKAYNSPQQSRAAVAEKVPRSLSLQSDKSVQSLHWQLVLVRRKREMWNESAIWTVYWSFIKK